MRIDIAIRFWTRNVKMVCNYMECWAFCERCGWDLERLYLQILSLWTDRRDAKEGRAEYCCNLLPGYLPCFNIALSRSRAAW
jgi:hypothetical protein